MHICNLARIFAGMEKKYKTVVVSEAVWARLAKVKKAVKVGRQVNGMSSATEALRFLLDHYEKTKNLGNGE